MEELFTIVRDNFWVIVSEVAVLAPVALSIWRFVNKLAEGQRCQLRADMLSIYYRCKDDQKIRQYEAEHFEKCYAAYKALNGNSFIDEIYEKAHKWEVIS